MDAQKCGEFITELRKEKNLTQKDLANELNVSDKAISRWETGKGFPDVDSLQSLSKFFSVTINELLAGEKAETKTIEEIAEENIISVINETEKNKKSKKTMTVLSIILALIPVRGMFASTQIIYIIYICVGFTPSVIVSRVLFAERRQAVPSVIII